MSRGGGGSCERRKREVEGGTQKSVVGVNEAGMEGSFTRDEGCTADAHSKTDGDSKKRYEEGRMDSAHGKGVVAEGLLLKQRGNHQSFQLAFWLSFASVLCRVFVFN